MNTSSLRLSLVSLLMLGSLLPFAHAEDLAETDPLASELLDNQSQTSLDEVDFSLMVFPQTVVQGDTVTYTFTLLNNSSQAVENARISHMLPLGISFIVPEDFPGNLTIESTNGPDDTLILRDLYLSGFMQEPFVFTIEALVTDWSSEGRVYNQAILDVFTATAHDQIVSDANLYSPAQEHTQLEIIAVPAEASSASGSSPVIQKAISTSSTKRVVTATGGSGKKGSRWAGMRREDLLKGAIGATEAESKAFVAKLNESRPYQVKTYVDRKGNTKFYGIVKGKRAANDFALSTRKTPPLQRSARTGALSLRPRTTTKSKITNTTFTQRKQSAVAKNLKLRRALQR